MLIVAVGIAVDYAAHVAHAFNQYSGNSSERAQRAMYEMGTCVWHGFVSTFLAIVVLAPSKSYVFESFFKQLFLASTLGIINGLFLLPILLKLIARGDHAGFERNHEELPEASADDVQAVGLSGHLQMEHQGSIVPDLNKDDGASKTDVYKTE